MRPPSLRPDTTRRAILLAGLTAGALLATACSRKAKSIAQTLPKEATLLCLGDSLTFGYGAAGGASYPQVLEQLSGHVTQNAGVNGDTAEGALARLPGLLEANTPGLVLVSIGGNDFLRGVPVERTRAALLQILQKAAAASQVVLIAEPRPDALAAASGSLKDHEVYAEVAAEAKVPLFAGAWSAVLSKAKLRSDPIHANTEGYKVFAEQLDAWLREQKFIA